MQSILFSCRFALFLTVIILGADLSFAVAQPVGRKDLAPVGEIVFVAGRASVRLVPEEQFRPAVPKQELVRNDL